jgi:heme oxygenase (biliverdin-IX-beta and delta-forming)
MHARGRGAGVAHGMKADEAHALRRLLQEQRVAALATLHAGEPAVSMVPFVLLPASARFVIHVSRLATHTADMLAHPGVSLLVTEAVPPDRSPLALPRASVSGRAQRCEAGAPEYREARTAYLARLPESEELFAFADFSLFLVDARELRYVAGFGRAMSLDAARLAAILGGAT